MNPELLQRYFRGDCTAGERARVERWLFSGDSSAEESGEGPAGGSSDAFAGIGKRALRREIWKGIAPPAYRNRSWWSRPITKTDSVDADDFLAWKDDRLVFADQSLREIAIVLERWYGIEVEIGSESLAAQRLPGRYEKPRLDRLLKSIAAAIGCKYSLKGKRLVLRY